MKTSKADCTISLGPLKTSPCVIDHPGLSAVLFCSVMDVFGSVSAMEHEDSTLEIC